MLRFFFDFIKTQNKEEFDMHSDKNPKKW